VGFEARRFPSQIAEDTLGDILGQLPVPLRLAQGGGKNQVDMAANQFGEGRFGPFGAIPLK